MPISSLSDVNAQWNGKQIADEIRRSLGLGMKAAAMFLASRVKELISVPAPRVRVLGKRGKSAGIYYYRATEKATPGAPPRKLSGRLRAAQTWEVKEDGGEIMGRVGNNVVYGRRLEFEGHSYLNPALNRWRDQLKSVMERATG